MKWFRMYENVVLDPKIQSLPIDCRWRWVELLCVCSMNTPRGELPPLEEVAFHLRTSLAETTAVINQLMDAGLVDKARGSKKLRLHHWDKWQFESDNSYERVKRFRDRKRNVSKNVSENVSETPRARSDSDTDSDTDSEKTSSPTSSSNGQATVYTKKLETPKKKLETTTIENEPPEFPEANGMFMIMPGDYPMDELDARKIWGAIWRAWKNPRLCFTFYEHQQWISKDGWIYAIKTALKTNGRPGSIKYLETIGVDFDVHGPKLDHPVQRGAVGAVPYKPQGPPTPIVVPMTEAERAADKAESDRLMAAYREKQKNSNRKA